MGSSKKIFQTKLETNCTVCGVNKGTVSVFPNENVSEEVIKQQRIANLDPHLIGLKVDAICPKCRRNLRQINGIEVVAAIDFIKMRLKYKGAGWVDAGRQNVAENPILVRLRRQYGG